MEPSPLDLTSLWETHSSAVRRFALLLAGDAAEADDLTAETFLRVWGARDRVDLTSVRSYLYAIARNLFLRSRRRPRLEPVDAEARPDPGPAPDRRAASRQELAAVLESLQELGEDDRVAIVLRAREGLDYEQIGRILGVSAAAARVRVHRARRRLGASRHRKGETP